MNNIERLARYLGTKRYPDQILEFLVQLPLDQFSASGFSDPKCAEVLANHFRAK